MVKSNIELQCLQSIRTRVRRQTQKYNINRVDSKSTYQKNQFKSIKIRNGQQNKSTLSKQQILQMLNFPPRVLIRKNFNYSNGDNICLTETIQSIKISSIVTREKINSHQQTKIQSSTEKEQLCDSMSTSFLDYSFYEFLLFDQVRSRDIFDMIAEDLKF